MSVNAVNSDGSLLRVAGGTLYADAPIGTISPFGGSTIPSGYLLCNGQAVSRTSYKELFATIGVAFGSGDGSTTFNVPDLREATTKGVGLNSKSSVHYDADGVALGEFIEDRVQDHLHRTKLFNMNFQVGGENVAPLTENGGSGVGTVGDIVVGRHGATTEVKAVGVNYIIKAKQVAVPADFMSAIEEVVGETTNWINGTNCKARKVNGIAYVSIVHSTIITLRAEATEVAVLPSGFAPSNEVNGAFLCDNQRDSALNGRVFPNGSICTWRDSTLNDGNAYDSSSILGFISYPID